MHYKNKKKFCSLREALRLILRGRRDSVDHCSVVGSGILRRQDPSVYQLSNLSFVSSLPDFESSRFELDRYEISIASQRNIYTPNRLDGYQTGIGGVDYALQSLLPKTSMSQLNDRTILNNHLDNGQAGEQYHTLSSYAADRRFQASMATFDTVRHSTSTLKLQRSVQTFKSISKTSSVSSIPSLTSSLYSPPRVPSRDQTPRRQPSRLNHQKSIPIQAAAYRRTSRETAPVLRDDPKINYFSSFCVLNTTVPGCPVIATSKDLKYIFDIGEQFCLNNSEIQDASMDLDIVTGFDAEGNSITHLVLYSPLVIPSSGRNRFVLASLIDITDFINSTASLPDLDCISERSIIEEELTTPVSMPMRKHRKCELSAEDLLGGCYIANTTPRMPRILSDNEDVWLDLATSEIQSKNCHLSTGPRTPPTSQTSTVTSNVDEVLDDFLRHLQEVYSDFFLLGRSPLDDDSYEICNVSPRVFASKDYIDGHLSHTSHKKRKDLEVQLTHDEAFHVHVRWGDDGLPKQLYCVPIFGRSSVTWLCFLVDLDRRIR